MSANLFVIIQNGINNERAGIKALTSKEITNLLYPARYHKRSKFWFHVLRIINFGNNGLAFIPDEYLKGLVRRYFLIIWNKEAIISF